MSAVLTVDRAPAGDHWVLGSLPPRVGSMALIGWRLQPHPVDAGVPTVIAGIIASALTDIANVSYPTAGREIADTDRADRSGSEAQSVLTSLITRLRLRMPLIGWPARLRIVSTRDSDTVLQAFSDATFAWHMGTQFLLLSDPAQPMPVLDPKTLIAMFEPEWANHAAQLTKQGVHGAVRAGVDGDVFGLLSLTPGFDSIALDALRRRAEQAQVGWLDADQSN